MPDHTTVTLPKDVKARLEAYKLGAFEDATYGEAVTELLDAAGAGDNWDDYRSGRGDVGERLDEVEETVGKHSEAFKNLDERVQRLEG